MFKLKLSLLFLALFLDINATGRGWLGSKEEKSIPDLLDCVIGFADENKAAVFGGLAAAAFAYRHYFGAKPAKSLQSDSGSNPENPSALSSQSDEGGSLLTVVQGVDDTSPDELAEKLVGRGCSRSPSPKQSDADHDYLPGLTRTTSNDGLAGVADNPKIDAVDSGSCLTPVGSPLATDKDVEEELARINSASGVSSCKEVVTSGKTSPLRLSLKLPEKPASEYSAIVSVPEDSDGYNADSDDASGAPSADPLLRVVNPVSLDKNLYYSPVSHSDNGANLRSKQDVKKPEPKTKLVINRQTGCYKPYKSITDANGKEHWVPKYTDTDTIKWHKDRDGSLMPNCSVYRP